jgi:hypothetical protein
MTTFTSDDRKEAYKKIVEAAPNQPGYEDAVPIPFAGWVSQELTDEEIIEILLENYDGRSSLVNKELDWTVNIISFARAILAKAKR